MFGIDDLGVIQTRLERQQTQKYESRDFPMSNLNDILDYGSSKLALFKFANAHCIDFLEMVLVLGSMIFNQVAKNIALTLMHSKERFSTTQFVHQPFWYFNARCLFVLLDSENRIRNFSRLTYFSFLHVALAALPCYTRQMNGSSSLKKTQLPGQMSCQGLNGICRALFVGP